MKKTKTSSLSKLLILVTAFISLDAFSQRHHHRWYENLQETGVAGNRNSDKDEACSRARERALDDLIDECDDLGGYVQGGESAPCELSRQHGNYRQAIEWGCGARAPRRSVDFVATESAGSSESQRTARRRAEDRALLTARQQCDALRGLVEDSFVDDTSCRRNGRSHNCKATAIVECDLDPRAHRRDHDRH